MKALFVATVIAPLRASAGRAALSVVAIALGVALGFAIFLINRAATVEMNAATHSLFGAADLVVQGASTGFTEDLYPLVARQPQVALASPVVEVNARALQDGGNLTLLGVDLLRVGRFQAAVPTANRDRESLAVLNPDRLLVSAAAANTWHLHDGDRFTIRVGSENVTFTVAGVLPPDAYRDRVGVLDIAAAQWRLQRLGVLTRIDLRLTQGADPASVAAALRKVLPTDVKVTTVAHEASDSRQLSRAFATNLTALALVALFTGGFLVYSMQSLSVLRRRRELALLHALGMTKRERIVSVVASGALLGTVGAAMGVIGGALLAQLGLHALGTDLGPGFASDTLPRLTFVPVEFFAFALLGVFVAVLGSLTPALNAARVTTALALKSGDSQDDDSNRSHTVLALVLWALAIVALLLPPVDGLPLFGYASIACILFGAVLMLPLVTRRVLDLVPGFANVSYSTALAHLRSTSAQATLSIAAILVSISLMVAMAIMVASLRGSFTTWLERLLPADIYVQAGTAGQATYLSSAMVHKLATLPEVARAEPSRSIDLLLPGDQVPITLTVRPLAQPERVLVIDSQTSVAPPPAAITVFASVALADRRHLVVGNTLATSLAGRDVTLFIRGIVRDYGNSTGALLMDLPAYRTLTGDDHATSLSMWLRPGVSTDSALAAVRRELASDPTIGVRAPQEIRRRSLMIFDRTFAITYVLEGLAVLIGMFGISVSSSAQVLTRRSEFGVLRHLGFTRAQIRALLTIDGVFLGTLGVIAGLAVGSVISVILIHVVSRQSFHWTMDLHVPIAGLVALVLAVPLAAGFTARFSGRAALTDDVVRAVKEDW